jgi:hypothetical protein
MRTWDYIASSRADMILANSQNTKNRIQKYHRKTSHILYPPVETNRFAKSLNYSTQKPHPDPLLKGEGEIGRLVSSSP